MATLRKPRIKRLDNFETALGKLVGKDKASADILRAASFELRCIADPLTYHVNELTLLHIVDSVGLGPKEIKKLHNELALGETIRTTALLMSAARSQYDARVLSTVLKIPGEIERFEPELPHLYSQMQQFIRAECWNDFVDKTSRKPDPPMRKQVVNPKDPSPRDG